MIGHFNSLPVHFGKQGRVSCPRWFFFFLEKMTTLNMQDEI